MEIDNINVNGIELPTIDSRFEYEDHEGTTDANGLIRFSKAGYKLAGCIAEGEYYAPFITFNPATGNYQARITNYDGSSVIANTDVTLACLWHKS